MTRRPSTHGFTLIELLVVISIIALLVGILLPALGKAREAAVKISGASQQRQVSIAMHTYATDNNGYAPIGAQIPRPDGSGSNHLLAGAGNIWGEDPYDAGTNIGLALGPLCLPGKNANLTGSTYTFGNYIPADLLYDPGSFFKPGKSEGEAFFFVRDWFGSINEAAYAGWSGNAGTNPFPEYLDGYGPWWGGGFRNYYFYSSYCYRAQDYSRWTGVGNDFNVDLAITNARIESPGYTEQAVIADGTSFSDTVGGGPNEGTPHRGGGNVIFGDGSGIFLASDRYADAHYSYHPSSSASWKAENVSDLPTGIDVVNASELTADGYNVGSIDAVTHFYIFRTLMFDRIDAEVDGI